MDDNAKRLLKEIRDACLAFTGGGDGATETTLASILAAVDGLEASLTAIANSVDGLEGFNDGVETLLTALNGYVDGLEGSVDGLETLATTLNGYVDGLEGLVDGLEGGIGAAADAAATVGSTGSITAKLRLMTSQLDAIQTAVQLIDNAVSGAGFNITQLGGVNITMNNGAAGTGVQRVTIADDSTGQIIARGAVAQDAAIAGNPLQNGGRASTAAPTDMSADGDLVYLWLTRKGATVVDGGYAHDAVDAGGPVKIGGRALAHGTNPTAVAAADRTDWLFNRAGIPWVIGGHPNIITKELNVTDADGAQTDAAIITVSSGTKIVVTKVSAMADGANTGDVACRIGFGTANVPSADGNGLVLSHPGIKSGSGVVEGTGAGIVGIGGDGEDLRVTCEDPAGGALNILVTYYTIES